VFGGCDGHSLAGDAGIVVRALATAQHMPIPFWFLPPILIIYLLAPVLAAIDRRPRLYWAVPVLLVTSCLMHLSLCYADVWQDTANLLPAYLLGMAIGHHRERALELLQRLRPLLAAGVVTMLAFNVLADHRGRIASARAFSTENGVFDATYLQKVFLTLWLLAFLAARDARETAAPSMLRRTLAWFGDRSFGIYFVHMYVVSYLAPPLLDRMPPLPVNGLLPMLGRVRAVRPRGAGAGRARQARERAREPVPDRVLSARCYALSPPGNSRWWPHLRWLQPKPPCCRPPLCAPTPSTGSARCTA
jgi:hypothetical protein